MAIGRTNVVIKIGSELTGYVVVDDNGTLKAQQLQFNETAPNDFGNLETLQNIKTFNTGHPEPPSPSGGNGISDLEFFDWMTILS